MQEVVDYNVTSNSIMVYDDSNPMTIDLCHIDFLQIHLSCCGVMSYKDWENNARLNETRSVPDSCCRNPTLDCGLNAMNNSMENGTITDADTEISIYHVGCEHQCKDFFKRNALIVGLITVGVLGIQIITIILSWCLSEQMRNKRWWSYRYTKKPFRERNYY